MKKEHYNELDLIKGFTIVAILFFHSFQLKHGNIMANYFITRYISIISIEFLMPVFFIVSGFLANTGKEYILKFYYINKFKRLVVPYLFINIIDYFPRTLFPNLVNSKFLGLKGIVFYGTKITWFLYTLIIIFLILPFLEKIWKKDKYLSFGIFLILINLSGIFHEIEILKLNMVTYQLIYFYLGYIIRNFYVNKIYNGKLTSNKGFYIISFVFLGFLYNYSMINLFTRIFFSILAFLFILNIVKRIKKGKEMYKILEFIGINSLTFYLLDGFAAVIWRTFIGKFILIDNVGTLVLILFITKILSIYIIIKYVITKNSIFSFLLGARKEVL